MRYLVFSIVLITMLPAYAVSAVPSPPSLTYTTKGTNISISWNTVSGASGYTLYYAPSPFKGVETIGSFDMGLDTSFSIDLWDGASYFIAVAALNNSGSSGYSNIEEFSLSDELTGDAAIIVQALKDLSNTVVGHVDSALKAQIEAEAAGYPLELSEGSPGITQDVVEDADNVSITYQIQRRDWLYARYGTKYTLMGAFGEGQAQLLDTGFWLFLQAAILHPEEPEHISNVIFHLNAKGMFQEALQLAEYAVNNLDGYAGVHNNMAYAKAALGDFLGAVNSSGLALAYAPTSQLFLDRLAAYMRLAGLEDAAEALENTDVSSFYPPAITGLTPAGDDVLTHIDDLDQEMYSRADIASMESLPAAQAAYDEFLNYTTTIYEDSFFYCPLQVLIEGAEDIAYAQCVNCYLPGLESIFGKASSTYGDFRGSMSTLSSKWHQILQELKSDGFAKIELSDTLTTNDKILLQKALQERLVAKHTKIIDNKKKTMEQQWHSLVADYQSTAAYGCGDAPMSELEQFVREDPMCKYFPMFCKKWGIWFGIGSFTFDPKEMVELTLGEGLNIKVGYNLKTDHISVGAGYGFTASVLSLGGSIRFGKDYTNGYDIALEAEPGKTFLIPEASLPQVSLSSFTN